MDIIIGLLVGVGISLALLAAVRIKRRDGKSNTNVAIASSIQEMKSVGRLSVFKIVTKEIVTATDSSWGEWAKENLKWLRSGKKMAMILEFSIDFHYDLQDPAFEIKPAGENRYELVMPPCYYETHIRDVSFYDEKNSKLLPWLLPDLINNVLGSTFSEEEKNKLIKEAKNQAAKQAEELVRRMQSEVQNSARNTLQALAMGFGAKSINFVFRDSEPKKLEVSCSAPPAA